MAEAFLCREEWPQIRGPHMTRHVGWAWPGEENEQAVAGRRSSRACETVFGQTSRIETAVGEPLLGEGSDNGSVRAGADLDGVFRNIPAIEALQGPSGSDSVQFATLEFRASRMRSVRLA
ncbi:hypothetical protein CO674_20155 [Rhizobium hidalgonense]|uniref:Uncharacterized protein n=1 Tax=Rhizobium hidalgonense TaxID=1538159 RepID=A0ABX4JQV7_9HYPH|nr:hypothetical protein CO674_20155 [Rhizobium hidalgonense]PON08513.1 hypothetical protein ATY29_05855 [Rhizobium hidalgonense]